MSAPEPEYTGKLTAVDIDQHGIQLTIFVPNQSGHLPDLFTQQGDEFIVRRTRRRVVTYEELP